MAESKRYTPSPAQPYSRESLRSRCENDSGFREVVNGRLGCPCRAERTWWSMRALVLLPLTRSRVLPWFGSERPREEKVRDGPARLMGWGWCLCRMNGRRGEGFSIGVLWWSSSAGWESHRESNGLRRDMVKTVVVLIYMPFDLYSWCVGGCAVGIQWSCPAL